MTRIIPISGTSGSSPEESPEVHKATDAELTLEKNRAEQVIGLSVGAMRVNPSTPAILEGDLTTAQLREEALNAKLTGVKSPIQATEQTKKPLVRLFHKLFNSKISDLSAALKQLDKKDYATSKGTLSDCAARAFKGDATTRKAYYSSKAEPGKLTARVQRNALGNLLTQGKREFDQLSTKFWKEAVYVENPEEILDLAIAFIDSEVRLLGEIYVEKQTRCFEKLLLAEENGDLDGIEKMERNLNALKKDWDQNLLKAKEKLYPLLNKVKAQTAKSMSDRTSHGKQRAIKFLLREQTAAAERTRGILEMVLANEPLVTKQQALTRAFCAHKRTLEKGVTMKVLEFPRSEYEKRIEYLQNSAEKADLHPFEKNIIKHLIVRLDAAKDQADDKKSPLLKIMLSPKELKHLLPGVAN